eukprot:scaffold275515_cov24-Tisochrysis_lutea.AAC.2
MNKGVVDFEEETLLFVLRPASACAVPPDLSEHDSAARLSFASYLGDSGYRIRIWGTGTAVST